MQRVSFVCFVSMWTCVFQFVHMHHLQASAASKWLSKHRIDPNDPRNALLLELPRAREAAPHSGQAVGAAGVFRCAALLQVATTAPAPKQLLFGKNA
jgi:hypothetical protein